MQKSENPGSNLWPRVSDQEDRRNYTLTLPMTNSSTSSVFGAGSGSWYLFGYAKQSEEYYALAGIILVLLVVSLVGNILVCAITIPKLWSGGGIPLNVLVLSLAVSDILKAFTESFLKVIEYIQMDWLLGVEACKFYAFCSSIFSNASIGTIALISLERFRSLDKPTGASFTTRSLSLALLLLWIWNAASSMPQAFWFTTIALPQSHLCTIPYPMSENTAIYTLITRIVNFFIPLLVSWMCYVGVIRKMHKSRVQVANVVTLQQKDVRARISRRVTVTCFALVMLFTITLMPFQLGLLILEFGTPTQRSHAAVTFKYLWILTLIKSSVNPFVYGIMWGSFRKALSRFWCPCCKTQHPPPTLTASRKTFPLVIANPNEVITTCSARVTNPSDEVLCYGSMQSGHHDLDSHE